MSSQPNLLEYVIWYRAGSGGFLLSWLVQVALDPDSLDDALGVFPLSLNDQHSNWKMHERTPDKVGVVCNMFLPNTYYKIDTVTYIREMLDTMHKTQPTMNDLLAARVKLYFVNFVYKAGTISPQKYNEAKNNPEAYRLTDMSYVRQMTDILFDPSRNIFIVAPEPYLEMAGRIKKSHYIEKPMVDQTLLEYPNLKIFHFETVWQKNYINELERLLEKTLPIKNRLACDRLIERYMDVMPPDMRKWCYEN